MNFNSELNTLAAHTSTLTEEEKASLNRKFKSINLLLTKQQNEKLKREKNEIN